MTSKEHTDAMRVAVIIFVLSALIIGAYAAGTVGLIVPILFAIPTAAICLIVILSWGLIGPSDVP